MHRIAQALAAALALALLPAGRAAAAAPPAPEAPAVVQVMVLGTFHFANPGLDLSNVSADDPTTPRRQAELARLADALARFRPTRIMVERLGPGPGYETPGYPKFREADLLTDRDEAVQIAFRLARKLGHKEVYGIDEREGPGKPDYFPFDKLSDYAKAHGQAARTDAVPLIAKGFTTRIEDAQRRGIADALLVANGDEAVDGMQRRAGYALLSLGAGDAQPGAELNAAWYLRNAKIFAKLEQACVPGDRVLVVFGSGHAYWLRHFASQTPGYASVDPAPYLRRAR